MFGGVILFALKIILAARFSSISIEALSAENNLLFRVPFASMETSWYMGLKSGQFVLISLPVVFALVSL